MNVILSMKSSAVVRWSSVLILWDHSTVSVKKDSSASTTPAKVTVFNPIIKIIIIIIIIIIIN